MKHKTLGNTGLLVSQLCLGTMTFSSGIGIYKHIGDVTQAGAVLVEFDVTGHRRTLAGEDLANVRLGYAQHIHRAQGATVSRTLVVTGGWQTTKEPAYVEASRARNGTNWFVNRQDLGVEGQDADRIERLAASMRRTRAQTPSLAHAESPDPDYGLGFDLFHVDVLWFADIVLHLALEQDRMGLRIHAELHV